MDKLNVIKRYVMFREAERLDSFKEWVFDDDQKCNAKNMAESGFFFIGNNNEPDSVQCFMCGKALDGWEPNDDPWEEHYKHAPNCTFVKNKMNEESYLLTEYHQLKVELVKNIANELREAIRTKYQTLKATVLKDVIKDESINSK